MDIQHLRDALDALQTLYKTHGRDYTFPPDEFWTYFAPNQSIPTPQRPPLFKNLVEFGYIERTGQQTNAISQRRRGSRVETVKLGVRFLQQQPPYIPFYVVNSDDATVISSYYPRILLIHLTHRDEVNNHLPIRYRTSFRVKLYRSMNDFDDLGVVKILMSQHLQASPENLVYAEITKLPKAFFALKSKFVSLGQDSNYYQKLKTYDKSMYESIMSAINDVMYFPNQGNTIKEDSAWRGSLLRYSEAEKVYREAKSLFNNDVFIQEDVSKIFVFTFSYKVPGARINHEIDLDFSPHQTMLHRITALIGKNGTGKTQLLAGFASAMSGRTFENDASQQFFSPRRPSFSKVIAVSYSVFDDFEKPNIGENSFSYVYCGIRQNKNTVDFSDLQKQLFGMIKNILSNNTIAETWESIINNLIFNDTSKKKRWSAIDYEDLFNKLSSGQRIVVYILTNIIQNIVPESIILFDEPETHLHPEAVATVVRALHQILEKFDSYAIIATHSPIILQEIPSRSVRVIRRNNNYPMISSLEFESFGENISNINDDVFLMSVEQQNYKTHLRRLAEQYSQSEILQMFENRLSFNARTFLSTIYRNMNQNNI